MPLQPPLLLWCGEALARTEVMDACSRCLLSTRRTFFARTTPCSIIPTPVCTSTTPSSLGQMEPLGAWPHTHWVLWTMGFILHSGFFAHRRVLNIGEEPFVASVMGLLRVFCLQEGAMVSGPGPGKPRGA